MRRPWTAAETALVVARYPSEPTAAIARDLRRTLRSVYQHALKLGLRKTAAYLAGPHACRLRRGDNPGWAHRFKKGLIPHNKGCAHRPGWAPGRMRENQFRKGNRPHTWHPVGTILTDAEGYQRIKVREGQPGEATGFGNVRVWPLLQRHAWETAHGPVPKGHVIAFRNGDKRDIRLDNLECISRRELMRRNTVHRLPKPLAETIQLLGALNRQIRKRSRNAKESNHRPS